MRLKKQSSKNVLRLLHLMKMKADASTQIHKRFEGMLKMFDREDLEVLYRIVKDKFKSTKLVSDNRVLWGYLMTSFSSLSRNILRSKDEEGKTLLAGKSSKVYAELFQKAYLYVIQNTDEIVAYIERHKLVLKIENSGKRIPFLENEHSKSFAKWLHKEVERELAISKESASKTIRWISYGPRATVVKYDAYNINGYTFRMKCHDGKVYQNSGVSVEAIDLHISKEVANSSFQM
ncbi:hypothetical protein Tco_1022167 [Tanacetum coccineum]